MTTHEDHGSGGWNRSLPAGVPFHTIALRSPEGKRRLPADMLREELLALPAGTWIVFTADQLGEPFAYAEDLMRRLLPLKFNWIAQADLSLIQKPAFMRLAQQSQCRAVVLDGEQIADRYFASEASLSPDTLARLTAHLQQLSQYGILSIAHFVFGYDTDDEGVFERAASFCRDARIGLPSFSVLTPLPDTPLTTTLAREGRLLQIDPNRLDGSHVAFQPRLMTPEVLANGLHWTRRQVYRHPAIWRRVFRWTSSQTVRHLLINYAQRRLLKENPPGSYTEVMRLLKQLSQPIRVREQASFISTLKDAVGETRRQLHGTLLHICASRNERLQALTLRLEGVLDSSGASEILQRIHTALHAGHQKIILDLTELKSVSPTVITRFLEDNAPTLVALRGRVVFRHLRTALDAIKENLGGVLPNAELLELATEEA